jgi:hypothetical protein
MSFVEELIFIDDYDEEVFISCIWSIEDLSQFRQIVQEHIFNLKTMLMFFKHEITIIGTTVFFENKNINIILKRSQTI